MGHKTVVKGVRESFHENLLLRGQKAQFIPLKNLSEWVDSFIDSGEMSRAEEKETCLDGLEEGDYECFIYRGDIDEDLPPHYHDKQETFTILEGSLIIEYMLDKRYARVTIKDGDQLTIPAGAVHRGTVKEPVVAQLSFKL